jgi:hypothetical protein
MNNMENLLEQALDGIIECEECGNQIEPDCPKCQCGWINPLIEMGFI